jgi:prepilin-type N-terminal cleavage/methylation domain-containing protein
VDVEVTPRRASARPLPAAAGFTFLELLVVMAIMATLLGFAVGTIKNIGGSSGLKLARSLLLESLTRTQQASTGGTLSIWTLREGKDANDQTRLEIRTLLATPVLTHQFESLDTPSKYLPVTTRGAGVVLEPHGGFFGGAARFQGGCLEFTPQAVFAMTEGLEIEAYVNPDSGSALMTLVQGENCYELMLVRVGSNTSYDVRLRVNLRPPGPEAVRAQGTWKEFETEGAPVKADGRWTRVRARFDGRDATIEVDGLDRVKRGTASGPRATPSPATTPGGAPVAAAGAATMVIAIPPEGAVRLFIGGPERPYRGLLDSLHVRGVFRNSDNDQELTTDLRVDQPALPLRVVFRNGRPDPDIHKSAIRVQFRDLRTPEDPPLVLEVGLSGMVAADYVPGGIAPPVRTGPTR